MNDQLSRFHREQSVTGTTSLGKKTAGKRTYEAFDKMGKPSSYMEIRCITQPSQSLQSRFFMAAIFNSDFDDAFTMVYSFMAVEVRGCNLKEIRRAIQNNRCEFIQEYHDKEFLTPGKNEPVIESIKFLTGEKLNDILATYSVGR